MAADGKARLIGVDDAPPELGVLVGFLRGLRLRELLLEVLEAPGAELGIDGAADGILLLGGELAKPFRECVLLGEDRDVLLEVKGEEEILHGLSGGGITLIIVLVLLNAEYGCSLP